MGYQLSDQILYHAIEIDRTSHPTSTIPSSSELRSPTDKQGISTRFLNCFRSDPRRTRPRAQPDHLAQDPGDGRHRHAASQDDRQGEGHLKERLNGARCFLALLWRCFFDLEVVLRESARVAYWPEGVCVLYVYAEGYS
jgi:hypothetical protein